VLSDFVAWSLRTRMLLDPERVETWTGCGPGTVEILIRWLGNIRRTLDGGGIRYTCLGRESGPPGTFPCPPGSYAAVRRGASDFHVFLCRPFWHPPNTATEEEIVEERALTLIHEVSHTYYSTEDSGMGPGAAECLGQFVADVNNIPIRALQGRCGPVSP
jgi:hypothetical protein